MSLDVGKLYKPGYDIDSVINESRSDLIPQAYTRELTAKERFGDAIQLRVFIELKCALVSMYERVLKILLKMISSHPDEILKTKEQVWLLIIRMMFGLATHPELHRKRYCRRYLNVKMVTLVREILKHMNMRDIIDGVLQFNSHIRFRAVKQLINDVFWDKRAEFDVHKTAVSVLYNNLREMQD